MIRPTLLAIVSLACLSIDPPRCLAEDDRAASEFFEKSVRPILANRCQKCHGPAKQKAGLRLDSRASLLRGGDNGPAVSPGKPRESLLIDAVNYGEIAQMPPKSKLPAEEIATLTKWVELGAFWPVERDSATAVAAVSGFNLKERATHWSFRPLADPALPKVENERWPINEIDRFLLARLEKEGMKPAAEADRRTLIRRLSFDLTGLPPSPESVEAFVDDASPDAYEKLVDRLLNSPAYGERQARRWLDLVRYAETSGHEFDYDIPDAWRYRDYLIRAFNSDLPYDEFVVEQIAGDLLERPRRDPETGANESILGTGFYFLGEGTHSPVDIAEDRASRVDNQIDVLGKAFLGLTIACARCHDHKFDPISTKDYYALAGYLKSSHHQHAFIDSPDRLAGKLASATALKAEIGERLRESRDSAEIGGDRGAFASAVGGWRAADAFGEGSRDRAELFEDFDSGTFEGWSISGLAFGSAPTRAGAFRVGPAGPIPLVAGLAHSGLIAERLQGVLRSKTFSISKKYMHFLVSGRQGRINIVVENFEKIRDPIYGGLSIGVEREDEWRWATRDVGMWLGRDAYLEIADGATLDYNGGQTRFFPGDGHIAVDEIWFSDDSNPPRRPIRSTIAPENAADVLKRSLEDWRAGGPIEADRASFLTLAAARGLIEFDESILGAVKKYRELDSSIPPPSLATAIIDGSPRDERVHVRGGTKTLGAAVSRRFLEVFGGLDSLAPRSSSGRLELARKMVDPAAVPIVPRVLVNRLWQYHFQVGLAATPDDFGRMGEPPSHPELLDRLARKFVQEGWSIKKLHRYLVLSRAYRMSSALADESAERRDPKNRLFHRMNVRRLEAEEVRDAILSVSGRLDRTLFGPSVPTHLTEFMNGRGRPAVSGPLDGDGRRSIYLNVRRNFLDTFLTAFDWPTPSVPLGRRNVSNVPAQALALLNDPFVLEQARLWGVRIAADPAFGSVGERIDRLYRTAFARPASPAERDEALSFLRDRRRELRVSSDDPRPWAELCHVLINVKEFLFIR